MTNTEYALEADSWEETTPMMGNVLLCSFLAERTYAHVKWLTKSHGLVRCWWRSASFQARIPRACPPLGAAKLVILADWSESEYATKLKAGS
jgi:hypothetical protein